MPFKMPRKTTLPGPLGDYLRELHEAVEQLVPKQSPDILTDFTTKGVFRRPNQIQEEESKGGGTDRLVWL